MTTTIIIVAILGFVGLGIIIGSGLRKNLVSKPVEVSKEVEKVDDDLEEYKERAKSLFRDSIEHSRK